MPDIEQEREAQRVVNRQRRLLQKREQDKKAALAALMATAEGRSLVAWLLEIGKVGNQPFTADPHTTAFQCGELNVGNQILLLVMNETPIHYLTLLQEQSDGRHTIDRDTARASAEPGDDPAADAGE